MFGVVLLAGLAVNQGIGADPASAVAALSCDQNTLYGVNSAGQLASIDATTGAVSIIASMAPGNNGLGVARNGVAAYAFANGANSITKYDATSAAVTTTNAVDPNGNQTVLRGAINPATGMYYYAAGGTSAYTGAFDPSGPTKIGQVGVISGLAPGNGDFAFSSRGLLFVVGANEIRRVDDTTPPTTSGTKTLTSSLVATLSPDTNSPGIAFSSDGYLFVSNNATVLKLDPASGAVLNTVVLAGGFSPSDLASCNYANTLSAQANVPARWRSTDQFALAVTGGGIVSGNTASTTGTAPGLQGQIAGAALAVPTKTYTATQTAAGTTDPSNYSTTYVCTNVNDSTQIAQGKGNTASFTFPAATSADGTDVMCTFTNTLTATRAAVSNDNASTSAGTNVTTSAANGVLSNDTGTGLTVTGSTSPRHGTVTVAADGSYVYAPTAGYSGADSFSYTATDSAGNSSTGTVELTVTPVATADGLTTQAGTPVTVTTPGILSNDLGSDISVSSNSSPAHGTVTIGAAGGLTYTPNAGYSGADAFTYTITDSASQTATAAVTVTVGVIAADDTAVTNAGDDVTMTVATGVLTNDSGTGLTVTAHTSPSGGVVIINRDGSYVYTPAPGFSGIATFSYTTTDLSGNAATGTVTITINPVAVDNTATTRANTPVSVTAPGVLGNDLGTGLTLTGHTNPAHGTVTVDATGAFVYTPLSGYSGPDSFTYTATDSNATSATATVNLTTTPLAADDTVSTTAGSAVTLDVPGVLANDLGTGIRVMAHTAPSNGTVTVTAHGSLTYTPNANFSGADTFTYRITDSNGSHDSATVSVTIGAHSVDDTGTTPAGTPLTISARNGLLVNDHGVGLTVTATTTPSHGTVVVAPDGSYVYSPHIGFDGTDTFTYWVTDSSGSTATGVVTITVTPVAAAIARPDDGTRGKPGVAVTIDPLLTDDPTQGYSFDPASLVLIDPATGKSTAKVNVRHVGVWTITAGKVVFTPAAGFAGKASVGYEITDTFGATVASTITVTYPAVATNAVLARTGVTLPVDALGGAALGGVLLGATLVRRRRRVAGAPPRS
jgi:hypothetical protein